MPGNDRSSAYFVWPVALPIPSFRLTFCPTALMPQLERSRETLQDNAEHGMSHPGVVLRVTCMRIIPVLLVLAGSALNAQDPTRPVQNLCVVPRDGTRCKAYTIVEIGFARPFVSTTSRLALRDGRVLEKTDFELK